MREQHAEQPEAYRSRGFHGYKPGWADGHIAPRQCGDGFRLDLNGGRYGRSRRHPQAAEFRGAAADQDNPPCQGRGGLGTVKQPGNGYGARRPGSWLWLNKPQGASGMSKLPARSRPPRWINNAEAPWERRTASRANPGRSIPPATTSSGTRRIRPSKSAAAARTPKPRPPAATRGSGPMTPSARHSSGIASGELSR